MKVKTLFWRLGAIMLIFMIGISCMVMPAYAYEDVDTDRQASLSVYFGEDGKGFSGVGFSVYQVAEISGKWEYILTGDFARYSVSFDDLDSSGWRALAQTLDGYAARDGLTPLLTVKTGIDGKFQLTDIETGLYLVTGEQCVYGDAIYTPEPMLVSVPGDTGDGELSYDMEVSCKFSYEKIQEDETYRKVQKVWNDGGNANRPKEITVQLLQDGKVVDTVTLNQANNWEYTWEKLDSGSRWQVVEKQVPDGYTVSVEQEDTVFVITNTRPSELPPKLPQTGMLWWPVPILAIFGIVLVVSGLIIRRKRGETDEK